MAAGGTNQTGTGKEDSGVVGCRQDGNCVLILAEKPVVEGEDDWPWGEGQAVEKIIGESVQRNAGVAVALQKPYLLAELGRRHGQSVVEPVAVVVRVSRPYRERPDEVVHQGGHVGGTLKRSRRRDDGRVQRGRALSDNAQLVGGAVVGTSTAWDGMGNSPTTTLPRW